MKLPVEESDFIRCDILDIVRWIRADNPAASVRFVEAFKSTVEMLSQMPEIGRRARTWEPPKPAHGG